LFVRLAVNPNVGDRGHPLTRGGIEYIQTIRQYQSVEEILLYVPDTGFDATFGMDCELHPMQGIQNNIFG
jgi:hypothetical protein